MDLAAALQKALDDTEGALVEVHDQINALLVREEALEDERRGLKLALARHKGEGEGEGEGEVAPSWGSLNRIEAVERMLRLAGEPLSPKELTSRLKSTERTDDEYPLVTAALAYMKKQGIVQQAGYGFWELSPDHRPGNVHGPEDEEEDSDSE